MRRAIVFLLVAFALGMRTATASAAQKSPPQPGVFAPLLHQTPKPNYGAAVPARVSGRVVLRTGGKAEGMPGVSVTDGYSVVKTGAQGVYTLTSDPQAVFVYITRPSAHDVEGSWYKPLAERVDFALTPAPRDETEYTFVHVTDTHISSLPASIEGLTRFVREVNALDPPPRFVVNSGDLVNLSKTLSEPPSTGHSFFRNYVGIMNHLAMPYYNVAGDHTDSSYRLDLFPRGDIRCGKPLYWEYLGPHYFSFEYGRIHFVSVDFGYHLGKNRIQGREYPTHEVQPMHIDWMRQDMSNRTRGCFVVTTSESDLAGHCPGFLEMARQQDVRLQLTGDDHVVAYESRAVPYRTGGSLSGCWWNPKCEQRCPDLSPAGYFVYRVKGEEMKCFYKGLGQRVAIVSHRACEAMGTGSEPTCCTARERVSSEVPVPVALQAHRMGSLWKGAVTVRAHVVQPRPNEALEYSLNGGDWCAMREISRPFCRALHEAVVDSTALPDGLVELRVKSALTGETRSERFVVGNGSLPARSEGGATLTFTVGKVTHGPPQAPAGKVDVVFNDKVVGTLAANMAKANSFPIPAASLRTVNVLRFRFARPDDGMAITKLVLKWQDEVVKDPRDGALTQVRIAHWGAASADWGGFIVGDGGLVEGPFRRRQHEFCFVLPAR